MIITDIKEFRIQYDEPLHLLRVEWAAGPDMRRLRSALEQLYQLATRLQVTHGVLIIDTLPDISAYDQIWLGSHWLPRTGRLALKQAVVVLPSAKVYNQQAIETLVALNRNQIGFDFQFFGQATAAMHWLTNESWRLPTLLAEWEGNFGTAGPEPHQLAEPRVPYKRF
jgi:hypothetical protein